MVQKIFIKNRYGLRMAVRLNGNAQKSFLLKRLFLMPVISEIVRMMSKG